MTEREIFQSEALRALVLDWLGPLGSPDAPDISGMTPPQLDRYRNAAKRLQDNPALKGEVNRLIGMYQRTLALQTVTDLERAYYRGAILAMRTLMQNLGGLAPPKIPTPEE